MKTRRKFVNPIPISKEAKYRFFSDMNSFHGCEVKEETEDMYFLRSIMDSTSHGFTKKTVIIGKLLNNGRLRRLVW